MIRGFAGILLDRDTGLLVLAPFWALALAGWATLFRRQRSYLLFASWAFVGVWLTAALHREWWGGVSPPGRPLVSALPLLVPLLAEGFEKMARGWGGGLRIASIAWAGVMAVALVVAPALMWPGSPKVLGLLSASILGVDVDATPTAAILTRSRFELLRAVDGGDINAVRRHLDAGGEVDAVTPTGRTPLMAAVQNDDFVMLEALIEAGADVNAADAAGWTPVMIAVRHSQPDFVEALVAGGADVNTASRTGWTPLLWASYQGSNELVGLLLEAGADVTFTSKAGRNALVRAAEGGHLEVVQQLLAGGADREAIVDGHRAAEWAALDDHTLVVTALTSP